MIRKLILAFVLLFLVGCQRDIPEIDRPNPGGSVGFRLMTEDGMREIDDVQSRGTPQKTLDNYKNVHVNVYAHTSDYLATENNDVELFREIKLEQKASIWKYTPAMFWPTDKQLSFIAYTSDIPFADAGISFLPETGAPEKITYKVPSEITKQPDLLVSTKFDQAKTNNVSLTMKHALACVSFCGIAPEGRTFVKSIALRNVYSEGTFKLDDPSIEWTVNLDSKGLIVFNPGIKDDQELGEDPLQNNDYLMTADGYLMMIPQTLTNAAIDVLYWNGSDETENKVITYILPVDNELYATWEPGRKYIYKFGSKSDKDITVVYYEKYADGYGLYYYDDGSLINTIDSDGTREILEAGYGVLSKNNIGKVGGIRLNTAPTVTSEDVVELTDINYFLYPVSQSGTNTFDLPASSTPMSVYFNNNDKSCGMILPHFAKGVYTAKIPATTHAIRTPQQMRNISALGVSSSRGANAYTQELDLDFSKTLIGGGTLTNSIVNCEFNDSFDGAGKKIENVDINAAIVNGALFLSNSGEIKDVALVNSSIISSGNTGGIAAENKSAGKIINPRIRGENSATPFLIQGSLYTGAIAGLNYGEITGNTTIEVATELPVAEVSGWVSIKGESQAVGGIAGQNEGTITTCLVNGVHVKGLAQGDVTVAKITIEGGKYVGGIVGVNKSMVDGNHSDRGTEPDIAGLVSIKGGDFVGGIAGENSGTLSQVNIRLGRGNANDATTITGGASVGGIVGYNTGTLKADGSSFISVRGNIIITGITNVGGIVGNNQTGSISNCFVYNFYSQQSPLDHHAPKIQGESCVGGIVGLAGTGSITKCAVFSTVSDANKNDGSAVNAIAEITATGSSVGGIVGRGMSGINISSSYVLGNVKITGANNSGGIVGENDPGTSIASVHIGNSGAEVENIYTNLFYAVNLPVKDARMQTNEGFMTHTSGTPTILGNYYVGGICGVNWGSVEGVSIKDNVKIGTLASTYVGGIAGGNGVNAIISKCNTYNPWAGSAMVTITGFNQIGGIVGVNNGIVDECKLGLPGKGNSRHIIINGTQGIGGIAGISGGHKDYIFDKEHGSGDDKTCITNCNVYGQATIEAAEGRVGGIIGQNGPTNKVINCNVIGYTSSYTNSSAFNYDITLKGTESVGGIAGANYGEIYGLSASVNNTVTHTAVIASNLYAGGLVGTMKARKTADSINSAYESKLYYCDVSYGVLIHTWSNATGAFAGQIEGVDADELDQTLFGTEPGVSTNRIYTGTTDNPVRITTLDTRVIFPPLIKDLPFPASPPDNGNLWADYQMWNYLYWTEYK